MPKSSPAKHSATMKARKFQHATEYTRSSSRKKYAIPPAAFARVARAIIARHGKDMDVGKISPKALDSLQRFVENSIVDQLDKARLIMGGEKKTLMVKHLKIVDKAFSHAHTRAMY